jgi:hypothetical protein
MLPPPSLPARARRAASPLAFPGWNEAGVQHRSAAANFPVPGTTAALQLTHGEGADAGRHERGAAAAAAARVVAGAVRVACCARHGVEPCGAQACAYGLERRGNGSLAARQAGSGEMHAEPAHRLALFPFTHIGILSAAAYSAAVWRGPARRRPPISCSVALPTSIAPASISACTPARPATGFRLRSRGGGPARVAAPKVEVRATRRWFSQKVERSEEKGRIDGKRGGSTISAGQAQEPQRRAPHWPRPPVCHECGARGSGVGQRIAAVLDCSKERSKPSRVQCEFEGYTLRIQSRQTARQLSSTCVGGGWEVGGMRGGRGTRQARAMVKGRMR